MTFQIRLAKTGEAEALARLFHDAVHTLCGRDYTPEQLAAWSPAPDPAPFARRMAETLVLVAEGPKGALLGFANLADGGWFDCLYVAPRAVGQGVATALACRLEQEARAQGCPAVVSDVSHTARPFFERRGYRVRKRQTVERRGVLLTNFQMEKVFL